MGYFEKTKQALEIIEILMTISGFRTNNLWRFCEYSQTLVNGHLRIMATYQLRPTESDHTNFNTNFDWKSSKDQQPPLYNGNNGSFLGVPRVVVLDKLDCII